MRTGPWSQDAAGVLRQEVQARGRERVMSEQASIVGRRTGGLRRVDPARRRGPLYRGYAWLSTTRPFAWVAQRIGWKLDPVLLRLTGGRLGASLWLPSAVLETRGARTGAVRRNALIYFHDGDDVIIMAAHLGLPTHPGWYHNLVETPDVTFGGEPFRASVVEDDIDRLWADADRVFPPYARYRRQAAESGRTIPLVRLTGR
jgi:deazaflavin-dependent oxidoreductase (nitroreductase family)